MSLNDAIAVGLVLIIFLIPIVLNMAFGGGDLRFGAFCALFIGLEGRGYFILFSGVLHLVSKYNRIVMIHVRRLRKIYGFHKKIQEQYKNKLYYI